MKILLTGGGTGGHFYPLIAVAEAVRTITKEEKLISADLYYMGPSSYNERALFENQIIYMPCTAGKIRRYFSLLNILDFIKTCYGVVIALFDVFSLYPDVVFAKGGYASFPALVAAKLLRIPVIIHESDSVPGRVNKWASTFAQRIAVSYPSAINFFPKEKVAYTGNPIRRDVRNIVREGAHEYLKLESTVKTVLILGGSLGSKKINDTVLGVLPELVKYYQVIHQTGKEHYKEISGTAEVILAKEPFKARYHPFEYLNDLNLKMAVGACDIIISRAGSTIFEIALWGKPSIVIPIPEEVSHDQRHNAYAYASTGACQVLEETNLTPHILFSEIYRILEEPEVKEKMLEGAKIFNKEHAADTIARELIAIGLEHEK